MFEIGLYELYVDTQANGERDLEFFFGFRKIYSYYII